MDTSFLSAMLLLNGKKACGTNLNKLTRIMNAYSGLMKEGATQKNLFSLLGELNPEYRPALTVFDKLKVNPVCKSAPTSAAEACDGVNPAGNYEPFVQYNNETLKRR